MCSPLFALLGYQAIIWTPAYLAQHHTQQKHTTALRAGDGAEGGTAEGEEHPDKIC